MTRTQAATRFIFWTLLGGVLFYVPIVAAIHYAWGGAA